LGDHTFTRHDVVRLLNERPGARLGELGLVLGCYRRPSETTYVVRFGDTVFEDVHDEELSFVCATPPANASAGTRSRHVWPPVRHARSVEDGCERASVFPWEMARRAELTVGELRA
jgi:hypothetical protein